MVKRVYPLVINIQSDFRVSQMMKAILSVIVIAFVAKVSPQVPPQLPVIQFDMSDFMAHQAQMQANERQHQQMQHMNHHQQAQSKTPGHQVQPTHQQGREMNQMEQMENEQIVGSPMALSSLSLNPLGKGLFHPLLGLPGLRFNNFNAGHFGGLHFANSILGAGNPMEANDQELQRRHHHHHWVEQPVGAQQPQQIGADIPRRFEPQLPAPPQFEPQLGAPQQPQEFWPWHHFANPDSLVGAAPMPTQEFWLSEQQQQFNPNQQMNIPPQEFQQVPLPVQPQELQAPQQFQQFDVQPMGPPAPQDMQFHEMQPQQMQVDDGARTWGKWGKKYDYGYG